MKRPSPSATTLKRAWSGVSPKARECCAEREIDLGADACCVGVSRRMRIAQTLPPARASVRRAISAFSSDVVSAVPPPPGLSCVSARMIGRRSMRGERASSRNRAFDRVDVKRELAPREPILRLRGCATAASTVGAIIAIGEHRGAAVGDVGGRKARREVHAATDDASSCSACAMRRSERFDERALRSERNEKRQLAQTGDAVVRGARRTRQRSARAPALAMSTCGYVR